MCNCLLVDKFHDLGLSILYNRMLVLSMQLGNSVCMKFESDGVVCPTKLLSNVFTTFAVDNTDENPSSHSTKEPWHGTIISSTQHLQPKTDEMGHFVQLADKVASMVLQPLPKEHTAVHPLVLKLKNTYFPCLPKRKGFPVHNLLPTLRMGFFVTKVNGS